YNHKIVYFDDNMEEETTEIVESVDEKRLLRKLDIRIIHFFISFLSWIAHLERDLGLIGDEFNWALSIFFVTYVICEIPSNIILIKFKPSIWIASLMVGWGVVMIIMAFVKNYTQLLVTRLLLGVFESGLFPGVIFHITRWYKRAEQNYRMVDLDLVVGNGHIFLIDGLVTIVVAFVSYFLLTDCPETSTWLTEDERKAVIDRLRLDSANVYATNLDKYQIYEAFKDWKIYIALFIQFIVSTVGYSYSFFIPSIVNGLGFNSVISQLLSIPPYILGSFTTVTVAILSDRRKIRGPYLILCLLVAIVGYVLLVVPSSSVAIKYTGACVVGMGLF
ncbi:12104_t:CDS:10, partial [Dentiscutata erythropus]